MVSGYVELHAKSFYSFGVGASHVHETLAQAKEYGYLALALTDTNLCGALEFARLANSLDIRPITGGELTLSDGSRLTLLAKSRAGYSNISRLFTLANAVDRREPRLDPSHLSDHSEGVVLLTGGRDGQVSLLAANGRRGDARELLRLYVEWYGPDSVYVELHNNLLQGDTDTQPGAGQPCPRIRRTGGGNQRRSLPPPWAVSPPGCAGRRQAQYYNRPGAAASQAKPPSVPEVQRPDGTALRRVPGGRVQHPANRGQV